MLTNSSLALCFNVALLLLARHVGSVTSSSLLLLLSVVNNTTQTNRDLSRLAAHCGMPETKESIGLHPVQCQQAGEKLNRAEFIFLLFYS